MAEGKLQQLLVILPLRKRNWWSKSISIMILNNTSIKIRWITFLTSQFTGTT